MTKEKKTHTKKEKKSLAKRILTFFAGVKSELKKVRWPDKKTLVKYSVASIAFIVFFSLFFFGIDVIFAFFKSMVK